MFFPTISDTILFLQFPILFLIPFLTSLEQACSSITIDKEALISFKSILNLDPLNHNNPLSTWAQESPSSPCNWTGVECNNLQAQRVVGLDLSGMGLSGPISPEIGNLSALQTLNLQNNRFVGSIPQEITKLLWLKTLNMSSNSIEGVLPSNMSRLRALEALDLMVNRITGKIPEELGELARLRVLKLGRNRFYGEIPRSLANVSSLTTLNLGTNNIVGPLPSELGRLRNLKELDIAINNLTGTIPPSIYNLTSLQILAVAANNLWGEIPSNIAHTLPNLLTFNFCINKFTGKIPASLHNLTRISQIRMAHNLLHGTVPPGLDNLPLLEMYNIGFNYIVSSGRNGLSFITSLTNSSKLNFLAIDGNLLEGPIPESIGNLSKVLSKLYMGGNLIHGEIPFSLARLTSLTLLNLSSNSLTGPIPYQIGELSELQVLDLANNDFSGSIPSSFGALRKLNSIDLSRNSLLGSVPSDFGNFPRLLSMDLSKNELNGTIPKECLNLPGLSTILNLSNNFFGGPLPQEIELLKNVVTIDLSNNLLTGSIPSSIRGCQSLQRLFMRSNGFFGPIPEALAQVKGLEVLDLSSNQLSGFIPDDLQELQALEYLNLSFNNLEGLVPKDGVFKDMSNVHLEGNKRLCFDRLACLKTRGNNGKREVLVVAICSLVAVLALSLAIVFSLYLRKGKAKATRALQDNALLTLRGKHRTISYEELRRATMNFSLESLVGRGSFGSVYKGLLSDGVDVAVKVLDVRETGTWKSFVAECEALRNIRHRNLVGLITSCSSMDFKGMEFLALVYEYLGNGSLEDWIRGRRRKENGGTLSVEERLNVAIDVACALDYMHNDCEVPVVHCDIKPSNILLGEDLVAKVGDFGLARLLMDKRGESQASISSTHVLKGSIGYIPPEYGLGEKPSTAGDAYSFGVMILELFTGMSPTHETFSAELNLPRWVHSYFPEHLAQVIDPNLLEFSAKIRRIMSHNEHQSSSDDQFTSLEDEAHYDHCLIKVIEIGLCCTTDSPHERMSMKSAFNGLKSAKHGLTLLNRGNIEEPEADDQDQC